MDFRKPFIFLGDNFEFRDHHACYTWISLPVQFYVDLIYNLD